MSKSAIVVALMLAQALAESGIDLKENAREAGEPRGQGRGGSGEPSCVKQREEIALLMDVMERPSGSPVKP